MGEPSGSAPVPSAGEREFRPRVSAEALQATDVALNGNNPAQALRRAARTASTVAAGMPLHEEGSHEANSARQKSARDAAWLSLAADLVLQGWVLKVSADIVTARAPAATAGLGETTEDVKKRIRASMEAMRSESLGEPPVRGFIRRMETRRPYGGRRVSVLDLVDSGVSLAEELRRSVQALETDQVRILAEVIRPVVDVVLQGKRCATTGLELMDVWRYFRLTWALPYRTTPGRTFAFLIRNSARPGHPVMGIGALASPVAQMARRDEWIGWTVPGLERRLRNNPEWWPRQLDSLMRTVVEQFRETRHDDLILEANRLAEHSLESGLEAVSQRAAAARIAALQPLKEVRTVSEGWVPLEPSSQGLELEPKGVEVSGRNLPVLADGTTDWGRASEDLLFVRKRAKLLADLLFAHRVLSRASRDGAEALARLTSDEDFRRAVSTGLREIRKIGIASRVLDLSVCGAIAPYGGLLAGKLVALSVGANELAVAYRERYANQVSVIASQMAGMEVRRTADFCAVATTSLYGIASSQYNRLSVAVQNGSELSELRWIDLGSSLGYGTLHLSRETLDALTLATTSTYGGRNVNYRFGEGPSPTLRQAREGIQLLVSDPNAVLNHEAPRRVYGAALAPGALSGLSLNEPSESIRPPMAAIGDAWTRRWLAKRVHAEGILDRVASEGAETVRQRLVVEEGDRGGQLDLLRG